MNNQTKDRTMATAQDLSKLSFADLAKRNQELQQEQEAIKDLMAGKREEDLKVLADGFAKKAQALGFSAAELIDALTAYLPSKKKRAPRGSAKPSGEKAYVSNKVYRNPNGPETWTGGTKGQLPKWLRTELEGLDDEAKKAKFADMAKK